MELKPSLWRTKRKMELAQFVPKFILKLLYTLWFIVIMHFQLIAFNDCFVNKLQIIQVSILK